VVNSRLSFQLNSIQYEFGDDILLENFHQILHLNCPKAVSRNSGVDELALKEVI